jgi:hypothetical protein
VRIDLDVIAVGGNGPGRAHVEALRAAGLGGAAVGADSRVVGEESGLLELAHHLAELRSCERLLERVTPRGEVALRRLRSADQRLRGQVEHHVEALPPHAVHAIEIDRADRPAGLHALAVRFALVEIDLVGEIDRLLGAGADAGVAARAYFEVDRVRLLPGELEGSEVALERLHLA